MLPISYYRSNKRKKCPKYYTLHKKFLVIVIDWLVKHTWCDFEDGVKCMLIQIITTIYSNITGDQYHVLYCADNLVFNWIRISGSLPQWVNYMELFSVYGWYGGVICSSKWFGRLVFYANFWKHVHGKDLYFKI